MHSALVALLLTGLVLLACVCIGYKRRRTRVQREDSWRPKALQGAPIAFAEAKFVTDKPFPLVAKLDRALRLGATLTLAELKTRPTHRIYQSDVIELSAQKLAFEQGAREVVNATAYVVTQNPETGSRHTHAVQLMSNTELTELAHRRNRILSGKELPRITQHRGLCRSCAFFSRCRPDLQT